MATFEMQPSKGFVNSAAPAPSSPVDADDRVRVDASGMATGTEADAWDMARMGRSQELRRNFKSLSVLGLATTTMSTWVALLLANVFSLTNGGLAGTVWVYLATWICTFALAASLAEMASMAPTSGGQYRKSRTLSKIISLISYSHYQYRLGLRVRPSFNKQVSVLHCWMACRAWMASTGSHNR